MHGRLPVNLRASNVRNTDVRIQGWCCYLFLLVVQAQQLSRVEAQYNYVTLAGGETAHEQQAVTKERTDVCTAT
jgi:hypothetical protein